MTEIEMTVQIQQWEQHRDSQPHEVAAKFLCEARSLLRAGKDELAERKRMAAFTVVGEVEHFVAALEGTAE